MDPAAPAGRGRGTAAAGRGRGTGTGRGRGAPAPADVAPAVAVTPTGRGRGAVEAVAADVAALHLSPAAAPAARPPSARPAAAPAVPGGSARDESGQVTRGEVRIRFRDAIPKRPAANPEAEARVAPRTIDLLTNYFALTMSTPVIYQYAVSFDPPVESRAMRYTMLESHKGVFGEPFAFDGMQLFLTKRLPDQITYLKTTRSTDKQDFDITVQLAREVDGKNCFQLYNIIFRKILRLLKLKQIGRHYFNPSLPAQIPQHNMELWPGYITAIAEYDAGVMLNIDVAHKVLRTDNVLDHIARIRQQVRNPNDLKDTVHDYLIGQVVLTRYNNRTYHIDDIAWDLTPNSSFKLITGEMITYRDYYKKAHNREIRDLSQPLLVHKAKKKVRKGEKGATIEETIYLVPELCCMTGFTDEVRKNFSVMKDISQHTIIPPKTRKASLERFIGQIYSNEEITAELKAWNMQFSRQLVGVQGRVLNNEKIYFRNKNFMSQNADWSRDLRQVDLVQSIPLQNWIIVYSQRAAQPAQAFIQNIATVAGPLGIQVARPMDVPLQRDGPGDYCQAIRERYVPGQTQLVVCILPDDRKDRYDAIKKFCVAENGIVSQCMLARTLNNQKIMLAALTKVALQMNVKLGGQLWTVDIPLKSCMVVGVDVYHDSLQKGTSVAGFCASMNATFTKYYTRVVFQRSKQELMDGLARCMSDALKKYFEVNKELPQRIILFRDGVGDGQMGFVVQHEVEQIKQVFTGFGGEYQPKFSVVIVKKRINSRMMVAGDASNPPPGTIVTSGITGKDTYDYFLVAQLVRQGTVTPTHYFVVYDTSGLQQAHLTALTFKLTHLYYNWPGTVRVPAPCQYAHKIAFLIGTSVHKEPHIQLCDKLYFL